MFERIQAIIERLQSLDDQRKKQVLIWGSGAIMFVIVVLWIAYISSSLKIVTETPEAQTTLLKKAEAVAVSFAVTTARGGRIVADRMRSLIGTDRTIRIEDNRQF